MKYTFNYLVFNNRDYSKHDIYTKLFAFLFSIIPTWFILNFTRISANTVTFIGLFFGILGAILGTFIHIDFLLYGFLLFLIFDFIDGNVAKAKGGGSYLGAILDMLSDRTILIVSVFSLINYHLINSQKEEILLLLIYFFGFIFLDVLALLIFSAKKSYKIEANDETNSKNEVNDFRKIIKNPMIWFPGRISSYIFIIAIFLATQSYTLAYTTGILCIISAFFTTFLNSRQLKKSYGKS